MIKQILFIALVVFTTINSFSQDSLIVNFDFNSDKLSSKEQNRILDFKKKHLNANYSFFGYCDTTGVFVYNIDLATRRIASVKHLLGEVKIGNENPIGESNVFSDRAKNRAVKIIANDPVISSVEREESELRFSSAPIIVGDKEVLDTIRLKLEFWGGTADFKEYSIPELYRLYDKIKEAQDINVEIHGHVCCADDYGLSLARAGRVRDYLLRKGVSEDRLTFMGHSNTQPRVPEISEENMQLNRRVEIVLYRKLE